MSRPFVTLSSPRRTTSECQRTDSLFSLCDWLWVLCEFCLPFPGVLFRVECLMGWLYLRRGYTECVEIFFKISKLNIIYSVQKKIFCKQPRVALMDDMAHKQTLEVMQVLNRYFLHPSTYYNVHRRKAGICTWRSCINQLGCDWKYKPHRLVQQMASAHL